MGWPYLWIVASSSFTISIFLLFLSFAMSWFRLSTIWIYRIYFLARKVRLEPQQDLSLSHTKHSSKMSWRQRRMKLDTWKQQNGVWSKSVMLSTLHFAYHRLPSKIQVSGTQRKLHTFFFNETGASVFLWFERYRKYTLERERESNGWLWHVDAR